MKVLSPGKVGASWIITKTNRIYHKSPTEFIEQVNVESTKNLYNNRLARKIFNNQLDENDTMKEAMEKIETNIPEAANKTLRDRKVKIGKQ